MAAAAAAVPIPLLHVLYIGNPFKYVAVKLMNQLNGINVDGTT